MDQEDDLKAFQRRMVEIISSIQPSIWRWRLILLVLVTSTLLTFYTLIMDIASSWAPSALLMTTTTLKNNINNEKSFSLVFLPNLLRKEIYFSFSLGLLISAFLFGIHRKMFASSILVTRFRRVLAHYNMSCGPNGQLIIKPRPTTYVTEEF